MKYQKIINLLDNLPKNQPTKFRTKSWVEINDKSRGAYDTNNQIKFETSMPKSILCDYSDQNHKCPKHRKQIMLKTLMQ